METFRKVRNGEQNSESHGVRINSINHTAHNSGIYLNNIGISQSLQFGSHTDSRGLLEDELRTGLVYQNIHQYKSSFNLINKTGHRQHHQSETTNHLSLSKTLNHQKFFYTENQTQESFQCIISKRPNLDSSIDMKNGDNFGLISLKRVKQKTYSIQPTVVYFHTGIDVDDADLPESPRQIIPILDGPKNINAKKYQLYNYHIMRHVSTLSTGCLNVLMSAYNVLRELFKNSISFDDIRNLSEKSFIVFSIICEKKFKVKIDSRDDLRAINWLSEVINSRMVDKRPEECKKIILSYTIKQLKHRLRETYPGQYIKQTFEVFFYQHYFDHISKSEGIPLDDFYYPIASTKCKKSSAKTINKAYLSNIRKSDKFMADVRQYMDQQFTHDYAKEIDNKLLDLVNKWGAEFEKAESISEITDSLDNYFRDSRAKLPWTIYEIEFALKKVRIILS